MLRAIPLILALGGCNTSDGLRGGTPEHAFDARPPPGALVLVGPSAAISGDTITLTVSSPDLLDGDQVDFGFGTQASPAASPFCPYRPRTGGSPCLDVSGSLTSFGRAFASGGEATVEASLTHYGATVYAQAFLLHDTVSDPSLTPSLVSNVLAVALEQPWPNLNARVSAIEDDFATGEDVSQAIAAAAVVVDARMDLVETIPERA